MIKKQNIRAILCTIMALLLSSEAVSLLAVGWLGLPNTPYPWSWLVLVWYGFYDLVLAGFVCVLASIGLLAAYWRGGFWRWLAAWLAGILALSALAFFLGILAFEEYSGQHVTIEFFLKGLFEEDAPLREFLYAELVGFGLVFLFPIYLLIERFRPGNKVLGNAHFANGWEVQRAGFLKKKTKV